MPFFATDGIAPYSFEVLPGGVGGSIDANGVYTAPNSCGRDTVRVTDDNSDTQEIEISVMSVIQILCEIIQTEMSLADDQVYIYNQRFKIPKDKRLYVSVGIQSTQTFGMRRKFDPDTNNLEQTVQLQDTVEINVYSTEEDALNRKEEVLFALNGLKSENLQAAYGFKVARLTSQIQNISNLEGPKIPFRFNITLNILYSKCNTMPVDYYDTFNDVEILKNR